MRIDLKRFRFEQWAKRIAGRPLVMAAIGLTLGIVARIPALIWICGALPLLLLSKRNRILVLIAFGVGLWISPPMPKQPITEVSGVQGEFDVISSHYGGPSGELLTVRRANALYLMPSPTSVEVNLGERVYAEGTLAPLPGIFGRQVFNQGIVGELKPEVIHPVSKRGALFDLGKRLREGFSRTTSEYLTPSQTGVVTALTFNDDARLAPELKDFLRTSGTIQVISTSGMHVAMITWVVLGIFTRIPIMRSAQIALIGLLLLVYVAAAGWRPPAIRAMIMILLMLIPYTFGRKPDGLSALAAAYLFSILSNPFDIFDIGLQLSYVAMLGMILAVPFQPVQGRLRDILWERFKSVFVGGIVITVILTPLLLYYFGEASVIAPIANLMIGFVVLPIVIASLLGAMIAPVFPGISYALFSFLVGPLVSYLEFATATLSRMPYAVIKSSAFSGWWIAAFYFGLLLMWEPKRVEWQKEVADEFALA